MTKIITTMLPFISLSLRFRKGYNLPRSSLPLIVVRACVRVNEPQKALHIISRKVSL